MTTKTTPPSSLEFISAKLGASNFDKIEMKNITLLTGANGSGKTMILKLVWIINTGVLVYHIAKGNKTAVIQNLQYLMDHSFDENNFTGSVVGHFKDYELEFTIENGKVLDIKYTLITPGYEVTEFSSPVFMSSETRLFTSYIKYIKLKKFLGITETMGEADMKKLTEMYKIYDIMFFERALSRFSDPFFKISEKAKEFIKDTLKREIIHVFYDPKSGEISYTEIKDGKSEDHPINTLSAGEQAWINMMVQN